VSAEGEGELPGDSVLLAEVDRPRGLRGEVVARLHADDAGRLDEIESVEIVPVSGASRTARIEGWKRKGDRVVIKLSGVETVDAARALAGAELRIPESAARKEPPAGRYFAWQLEGMDVVGPGGAKLGSVARVLNPSGQSLLEVKGRNGEYLVPLVAAIVVEIDLAAGRIVIDPPEGLIELNAV